MRRGVVTNVHHFSDRSKVKTLHCAIVSSHPYLLSLPCDVPADKMSRAHNNAYDALVTHALIVTTGWRGEMLRISLSTELVSGARASVVIMGPGAPVPLQSESLMMINLLPQCSCPGCVDQVRAHTTIKRRKHRRQELTVNCNKCV